MERWGRFHRYILHVAHHEAVKFCLGTNLIFKEHIKKYPKKEEHQQQKDKTSSNVIVTEALIIYSIRCRSILPLVI